VIPTLFLLGPSDIEGKNVTTSAYAEDGTRIMTADVTGVLPLLPFVTGDRLLSADSYSVMLGVNQIRLPPNPRVNIFNLMGDPDACSGSLHHIQVIANKVKPQRFFNEPSNVFKTSRARLPTTLAGIPGCIVPRVEAADPADFSELHALCDDFGCWPMIVRARGYHGGDRMILVSGPAQLESFSDLTWLYDGICLVEYIDYKDEGGLYQKNRVIVIDGVAYPRHAILSDKWIIHAGSRNELMSEDLSLSHREEEFLARGLQQYTPVFREIYERIGLDIFGIDFALVNGEIVIFEANPCMKFLDRKYGDARFQYLDDHVKALQRAIRKMLLHP